MSDINVRKEHGLGLATARKVAMKWAEHAEKKLDVECTMLEGDTSDTLEFKRAGVTGQMIVAADHFEITAKLGFLFKAFASQFEAETRKQLDEAVAKAEAKVKKA
ncbi:MAG: polyhydroxyalkanoic acid synthase [Ideonella sp. MAG2]|nr:MAG: polyhydroxyalkanoic acid synthase [Ideonella sp. MAG2]